MLASTFIVTFPGSWIWQSISLYVPGIQGDVMLTNRIQNLYNASLTLIPASSAVGQSSIWILEDDLNSGVPQYMNHIPGGSNVLYMDGHVAFMRYPSETPVSVA